MIAVNEDMFETPTLSDKMLIQISGTQLRQMFHPCEANFIMGKCRGRCCEGTGGIHVFVHDSEIERIKSLGGKKVTSND